MPVSCWIAFSNSSLFIPKAFRTLSSDNPFEKSFWFKFKFRILPSSSKDEAFKIAFKSFAEFCFSSFGFSDDLDTELRSPSKPFDKSYLTLLDVSFEFVVSASCFFSAF